ncbi:MAG: FAD-dependent oxidoreductase [Acidobacteria bacterium]|nr:FAD-dependent oxidoreductase [Acidobacteriota bacterium]
MGYDLAVAGGGPAGAAAAITAARQGSKVLLLEAGRFPRHKVCGEFVSSEAVGLLRKLLGPEFASVVDGAPVTREARFFGDGTVAHFSIPPAASISRYELDAALWRAAQAAGADCRLSTPVESVARRDDRFLVRTPGSSFIARSMIDASGRQSKLKKKRAAGNRAGRWVGLKAHFSSARPVEPVTDMFFFPGGYCGIQPLSSNLVNVCALVAADVTTRLKDVFELHPELARRREQWGDPAVVLATASLLFAPPEPDDDGLLHAGDRAAFIDPFAGDGISMALRGGALAAAAAGAISRGDASIEAASRQYHAGYCSHFAPALRFSARLRMLMNAPAFIRKAALSAMGSRTIARYVVAHTR